MTTTIRLVAALGAGLLFVAALGADAAALPFHPAKKAKRVAAWGQEQAPPAPTLPPLVPIPSGTDDPCVNGPRVDSGTLLNQDCDAYICIVVVFPNSAVGCNIYLDPGTDQIQFKVLWAPVVDGPWDMDNNLYDANGDHFQTCGAMSGDMLLPITDIPPCALNATGVAPWNAFPFIVTLGTMTAGGTIGFYVGAPIY